MIVMLLIAAGLAIWAYQTSRQLTLAWDPMPPGPAYAAVRIYDIAVDPPALVAEAQCSIGAPITCPTEMTFIMPRAAHTYVARSWDGFWESGDSNSVVIGAPPPAPTGLRKK
jgi:hypothetical protein